MTDIRNYVLVVLAILSIMMMSDIKDCYLKKRDSFIQVIIMISIFIIMYNVLVS